MAVPATSRHAVQVELTDDELDWLRVLAARWRVDESDALARLLRPVLERQRAQSEAREQFLEYLGDAAELGPGEEEALLREIDGED